MPENRSNVSLHSSVVASAAALFAVLAGCSDEQPTPADMPSVPAVAGAGATAPQPPAAGATGRSMPTMASPAAPSARAGSAASAPRAGATGSAGATAGTAAAAAAGGADAGAAMDPDAAAPSGSDAAVASAPCDRACLTEFNEAYLAGLVAHDASKLATADTIKFTENGKLLKLGEGLWAVASSVGDYRQDFAEVPAGMTAGFAELEDDSGPVLVAFRMKVVDRKVTELETTVCRSGEATFFSPDALMHNPIYDEEIPAAMRASRDEMIATVDLYFQGLESGDGSDIPYDDGARRNENGTVTARGSGIQNVAMFSYIETIERRYALVDEERGNVLPWVLFQIPMGIGGGSRTLHLAELFKVQGGKIMDIQAIMVNQPLGTPGGWE